MKKLLLVWFIGIQSLFAQPLESIGFESTNLDNGIFSEAFEGMFDSGLDPLVSEGVASPSPPVPLNGYEFLLIGLGLLSGAWTIKSQKCSKFGADKGFDH